MPTYTITYPDGVEEEVVGLFEVWFEGEQPNADNQFFMGGDGDNQLKSIRLKEMG